jgi:5,10-methylenetetrahydrofolate reductase
MNTLAAAIHSGNFVITAELNPPKGTNLTALFEKINLLKGRVTACNLTDSHTARMTMSPLAVAHLLLDRGVDPILQVTGRDRNRIALQADLLGAAALGVTNVVCMSGDDPQTGDHPQTKPVFDLDAITLLRAVSSLQAGRDLAGNPLDGVPRFYPGAVVNPGASDLTTELRRMEDKAQAGAQFFQTQAVYDPRTFETFMNAAQKYNAPIIAGVLLLKSAAMARHLNDNVPGISVPDALIQELAEAQDRATKSIEIGGRLMKQLKPMCQGVHLMTLGWEARIPQLLQAAEIA